MSDYFPVVSGGAAIDRVINQPFTMGITSATPGDLSVAISNNTCRYDKLFEFVEVSIMLTFTPTYTTAAGAFILTGLPFAADNDAALSVLAVTSSSAFPYPVSSTQIGASPQAGATTMILVGQKTNSSGTPAPITTFTSATAYTLRIRGRYRTARV